MDIWVDTASGTYGDMAFIRVMRNVPLEVVENMETMSDSERSELAEESGVAPKPLLILAAIIDQAFRDKRAEIVGETPPNETQEWMTEGMVMGLDAAQMLVHEVLGV